jgi:hypothetical protein
MTDDTQTQAPPSPAVPAPQIDPDEEALLSARSIPADRFRQVIGQRNETRAALAAAEARAAELDRRAAALEADLQTERRSRSRLEVRADLGIDDDDDADRVLTAWERATADRAPAERPRVRDWITSEGVLDSLPRSIRTAYGSAWQSAGVQATVPASRPVAGASAAQTQPTPSTSRGTAPAPGGSRVDPGAALTAEQTAQLWRRLAR